MIKIVICDDEKIFLDKITQQIKIILAEYKIYQYDIKTYFSGRELCQLEEKLCNFQIFFLDINMENMSGLETADRIRKINKNAFIVFVTAYVDYAIEGYKVEAFRFISKDMLESMLRECIKTIIVKLEMRRYKFRYDFIEGTKEFYTEDIIYIESRLHKLFFYVLNPKCTKYSCYDKLDSIQNKIDAYGFLRIHKSFMVNMKYIEKFTRYHVKLVTGIILPIPKTKYKLIEENYYEYKGKML